MPHVGNGPAVVHTTGTKVITDADAPRGDPPDVEWNRVFANWATDRGHEITAAKIKLIGTPYYVKAHERFLAGASEKVIRALLDQAYS